VTLGFNTRLENIEIRGDWVRANVPSLNLEGWVSRAGVAIDLDPAKVKPVATGSLAALTPITPLKPAGDELIDVATTKTGDERRVALTWNRYGGYIRTLAEVAEIDPLAAVATFAVESGANAYDSNGKMIIRVEAHLLYDKAGPNGRALWVRHFTMASPPTPRWQGHTVAFPGAPRVAYHGNNTLEWKTLELAGQLFGGEDALDELWSSPGTWVKLRSPWLSERQRHALGATRLDSPPDCGILRLLPATFVSCDSRQGLEGICGQLQRPSQRADLLAPARSRLPGSHQPGQVPQPRYGVMTLSVLGLPPCL
jgi:hypothetical protein